MKNPGVGFHIPAGYTHPALTQPIPETRHDCCPQGPFAGNALFPGPYIHKSLGILIHCYPTDSNGVIHSTRPWSLLPDPLNSTCLRGPLLATARLFNASANMSQSGFYVLPQIFISGLHFASFVVPYSPTSEELDLYIRNETSQIYISSEMYNEKGREDDSRARKAVLIGYDIEKGIGAFEVVEDSLSDVNTPIASMVRLEEIIEEGEVREVLESIGNQGAVVLMGYHTVNYGDSQAWEQAVSISNETTGKEVLSNIRTPDFGKIFLPNRRSVSCGVLERYDAERKEVLVDASVWKGYSGGSAVVVYNDEAYVIGIVKGGCTDDGYIRISTFPSGLREYIKTLDLSVKSTLIEG
ncbi:hypothetical protein ABW19_dt0209523 [Dactylella cylindrospora]|nr:hypothetical protein ABW19_dt0209523 [Dactylella cylindrospora]